MNYTPHTPEEIRRALERVGAESLDDLFEAVPAELRDPPITLPPAMDEVSLLRHLRGLAARNEPPSSLLGGGARSHFIPTVTPHLALQSEFVTSYTPYQPEVAQGILQATFEYQTIMAELTALDVSNASMYDGATAAAEAALLAVRHTDRERVAVSLGVHPETREVLATYLAPLGVELVTLPLEDLTTATPTELEGVACVIAQQPNFLGYLERMPDLAAAAHGAGALFVAVADPLSLALLPPPGEYGADVAVGDGQTLGNPLAFGGPSFGFMVVKREFLRQMPGRLVGQTVDQDGRRAFVLTLQAREQHIRRSKAKSNICSNHQLTAVMAAINAAALGPAGLREAAVGSVRNAHALADELERAGFTVRRGARFFNEFALEVSAPPAEVRRALAQRGVQAGVPVPAEYGLGQALLLTATELTTSEERAGLVAALSELGVRTGREEVAR